MNSLFSHWTSILRKISLLLVLSILLPIFGISNYAMAAEEIYVSYLSLEISLPISTLESYANTGVINDNLGFYQKYLPAEQLQRLQKILLQPITVSPVLFSQFLYTSQGEFLLSRLTQLIKNPYPQLQSELPSLRSALILASKESEGITLLSLLRHYPTISLHIDLVHSLKIVEELEKLIRETNQAIALVEKQSSTEAVLTPNVSLSPLPSLQTEGNFTSDKYKLDFFDLARHRRLLTDIYIPHLSGPTPIIVISHGLGLDSSNFRYLAIHLASHGFAVVVPNHPGSDAKQFHSLLNGEANELAEPSEFKDRPLDVKFILDQLEKKNESDPRFQGKLNLEQVGVYGQSLGGYTALALGGAKINFRQLAQDCKRDTLEDTWNMSLLLQCQAKELATEVEYNLEDKRVKAIIAVNPITSSIFGQTSLSQIKIPVMFVASTKDTMAPALYEQIIPFSWLTNAHKYLALLIGGTHFSTIGNSNPGSEQVDLPEEMIGDAIHAHCYMNALSVPFFKTYVEGKSEYNSYLNAAYAQSISTQSLGLSVVESLNIQDFALSIHPQTASTSHKNYPRTLVGFGFWMLSVGVSLLHL